ncbi:hypothetical protein OIU78_005106 [Salix suchowensis]|nr:hypothetical protein OIU78_005106 [Salix suchowensis]
MATKTPKLMKLTVLLRFSDDTTREQIDNLINDYTNLSNSIPAIISFSWGTDLGVEPAGLNHGYTHAFEFTFESLEGLQEYLDGFKKAFEPCVSQILVMDYFLY